MKLQALIQDFTPNFIMQMIDEGNRNPNFMLVEKEITSASLIGWSLSETSKLLLNFEEQIKKINPDYDVENIFLFKNSNEAFYVFKYTTIDKSDVNINKFINDTINTIVNELIHLISKSIIGNKYKNELDAILDDKNRLDNFLKDIVVKKMYTNEVFYSKANKIMVNLFLEGKISLNDIHDLIQYQIA